MKLLTPIERTLPWARRVERPVRVDRHVEGGRDGLVQDEHVELLEAELAGALVERVERLAVAEVGDPHLGLDEDLGAVDTRRPQPLADLALVEVRRGGVDVPVAELEGGPDRFCCELGW